MWEGIQKEHLGHKESSARSKRSMSKGTDRAGEAEGRGAWSSGGATAALPLTMITQGRQSKRITKVRGRWHAQNRISSRKGRALGGMNSSGACTRGKWPTSCFLPCYYIPYGKGERDEFKKTLQ